MRAKINFRNILPVPAADVPGRKYLRASHLSLRLIPLNRSFLKRKPTGCYARSQNSVSQQAQSNLAFCLLRTLNFPTLRGKK
ncbi:hypothetical protein [Bremerella cremea]|uniref:hypothetical protein n=1 Tax=Bremerella cremea TaxID=1031537 RepID=UPI0011C024F1|nr:hypothetical protein [Bremerella cremea]